MNWSKGIRPWGRIMETLWGHRFAQRTQMTTNSVIREIVKITTQPE
ncbi:MAG: hypothetical protein ABSC61_07565 [Anaerolineales bacterium]